MAAVRKKISAAQARAHTRKQKNPSSFRPHAGMIKKLVAVFLVGLIPWFYQAIQPPPPKICGSPNGPAVTSSRIKLKDGRHLSYIEFGVPKNMAKHKIIFIHGYWSCKYDLPRAPAEMIEELGVYFLSFDRSGYGESDPHPQKTEKSIALDVEELADQLEVGIKFYVVGFSMGGELVWSCLKHIPHRLAGAALLAPVSNYWWPCFPSSLIKGIFNQRPMHVRLSDGIVHYVPWLTYWWNTARFIPRYSVVSHENLSSQDREIVTKLADRASYMGQVTQQGEFESLHRDLIVNFGTWDFNPLDLLNPFPDNDGSVHLWHGVEDRIVPVNLSRFIVQKLPWVHFHELPHSGHMFPMADGMAETIYRTLLLGDQ